MNVDLVLVGEDALLIEFVSFWDPNISAEGSSVHVPLDKTLEASIVERFIIWLFADFQKDLIEDGEVSKVLRVMTHTICLLSP